MNTIPSHKALLLDSISFIFCGIILWAVNIFGQTVFPVNNFFPFLIRSLILLSILLVCYYLNYKFIRKNQLKLNTLKLKSSFSKYYFGAAVLGVLIIATIWTITYLIYPFSLSRNPGSTVVPVIDIISYGLGNTLEELLFRGFLLLSAVTFLGKAGGLLFVSFLFGLFHLPGFGLTREGLSMVITTFTMSLLFVSVIYYTESIWAAVILHIIGNILLHTLGFDGMNHGLFLVKFASSHTNRALLILIYEVVVLVFSLALLLKHKKSNTAANKLLGKGF